MFEALYNAIAGAVTSVIDWGKEQFEALYDFIGSVVGAVWDAMVGVVATVWQWLYDGSILVFNWVYEYVVDFWGWAIPRLKDVAGQLVEWVESVADAMGWSIDFEVVAGKFNAVADLYADAAWLLPLNQVMAIVVATFVLVAGIRFARWVLSFFWITG
jgi:hypothetical protein